MARIITYPKLELKRFLMAQELILNILLASLRRIEIYPKADRTLKRSLLEVTGDMALDEILKVHCQKLADFHATNLS